MQIATKSQPIEGNLDLDQAVNFTLEANTKAFDILSSNLYQDKPEAIVRELGCNAYDSHVANGNPDEPFLVSLPTGMAPYFKIRDYGTGLSHDDMVGLYTTYFGSNKRDTNSLIGGLGLGSKTPFAYCDAFAVTSYFNNFARQYSVFRNEDGCPAITLVSESSTDEPNGLEIVVPVKENDFHLFFDRAKNVYKWFPVKPRGVDVLPVDWKIKKDNYGILEGPNSRSWYGLNHAKLLMGNVLYSISGSALQITESEEEALSVVLKNSGVVVFAEIGDVDIAASREALSYDKKSIAKLKQLITIVANQIIEDSLQVVYKLNTKYEQYHELHEIDNSLGLGSSKLKDLMKQLGIDIAALHAPIPRVRNHYWNLKSFKKESASIHIRDKHICFLYSEEPMTKYTQWLRHNADVFDRRTVYFLSGDWSEFSELFNNNNFSYDLLIHIDDLDEPPKQVHYKQNTSSGTAVRTSKPVSLYKRQNLNLDVTDFTGDERSKQMLSFSHSYMSNDLDDNVDYLLVESYGAKHPWGQTEVENRLCEKFVAANKPQDGRERILFIPKSVGKRVKKELFDKYSTYESFLDHKVAEFKLNEEVHSLMYDLFDQITEGKTGQLISKWARHYVEEDRDDPVDNLLRTHEHLRSYVEKHSLNYKHTANRNWKHHIDTMLGEIYLKYPWLSTWLNDTKETYYYSSSNEISWKMFNAIRKECNDE